MPEVIIDGQLYIPAPEQNERTDLLDKVVWFDELEENLTIRGYFRELLQALWIDEDFNAKRPFGDGAWKFSIYKLLIEEGLVNGKLDKDGYVNDIDEDKADDLILKLIAGMCEGNSNE